MSYAYLRSLLMRTARIQKEIDNEQGRKHPDWIRLLKLKKLRLVLKDRLARLGDPVLSYDPRALRAPA